MLYTKIKKQAEQFLGNYKSDNPATFAAAQQAIGGLLILDGFTGIDNPFGGKKRKGIFGSLIGVVLGLVFLFGTNFIVGLMGINKLTGATTAEVVSVTQSQSQTTGNNNNSNNQSGGACYAEATYTVDGQEFTHNSFMGSSSLCSVSAGQTIEINYNPENPSEWAHNLTMVKSIVKFFPYIGAVAAVASLVTFGIRLLSILFGWKLLKSGRALAKTLPEGTDLSTIKNEITQNFSKSVFGMGGSAAVATAAPGVINASPAVETSDQSAALGSTVASEPTAPAPVEPDTVSPEASQTVASQPDVQPVVTQFEAPTPEEAAPESAASSVQPDEIEASDSSGPESA